MQGDTREATKESEPRVAAAHRAAAKRRDAFQSGRSIADRGRLIDSLVMLAGESLSTGDDPNAAAALQEAEQLLPAKRPMGGAWGVRSVNLYRAQAGLAQKQGRHADAIAAFEKALSALPSSTAAAGRDANAVKLQTLVHLARSRLALGQAKKTVADMHAAEKIMTALEGAIPSRAIETVRAAVQANSGVALAALGQLAAAETAFATSLAAIDRLGAPELAGLRTQVLTGWAWALRSAGRTADAEAMLAAFGNAPRHVHDEHCGCGHDHAHGHDHSHAHHHHHHADCGCASHSD